MPVSFGAPFFVVALVLESRCWWLVVRVRVGVRARILCVRARPRGLLIQATVVLRSLFLDDRRDAGRHLFICLFELERNRVKGSVARCNTSVPCSRSVYRHLVSV